MWEEGEDSGPRSRRKGDTVIRWGLQSRGKTPGEQILTKLGGTTWFSGVETALGSVDGWTDLTAEQAPAPRVVGQTQHKHRYDLADFGVLASRVKSTLIKSQKYHINH